MSGADDMEMREYLESALSVLRATASMFGVEAVEVSSSALDGKTPLTGASVELLRRGRSSVDVQVLSSESGSEGAARVVLSMEASEPIAQEDIHDAIAEIANIVAGGLTSSVEGSRLGLPEPVGPVALGERSHCAHVSLGGAPIVLLLRAG